MATGTPSSPSGMSGSTGSTSAAPVTCVVDSTVVEFRTVESGADEYQGEFGFDWLRVKEAATTKENQYIDAADGSAGIVRGGYRSTTQNYTATEAKNIMRGAPPHGGDYDKFTINRPASPPSTTIP